MKFSVQVHRYHSLFISMSNTGFSFLRKMLRLWLTNIKTPYITVLSYSLNSQSPVLNLFFTRHKSHFCIVTQTQGLVAIIQHTTKFMQLQRQIHQWDKIWGLYELPLKKKTLSLSLKIKKWTYQIKQGGIYPVWWRLNELGSKFLLHLIISVASNVFAWMLISHFFNTYYSTENETITNTFIHWNVN